MKKWNYTVSTNTIWTSFDYGEVEAESFEEAVVLAEAEVKLNFTKANEALKSVGMKVECALDQIQITEIKS